MHAGTRVGAKPFWSLHGQGSLASRCGKLPATCDVAVIGGGLTGVSVAFWLRNLGGMKAPSICVLEERDFMSGATGRNGGHLNPFIFGPKDMEAKYGQEQVMHRVKFEMETAQSMWNFAKQHDIKCDLCRNGTVFASQDPSLIQAIQEDAAEYYTDLEAWNQVQCETNLKTSLFSAALCFPSAAQLWPAKFGLGVLEQAENLGTQLFANSSVLNVAPYPGGGYLLQISHGRSLHASRVVYATNGYAQKLLPELSGIVQPCRGQILMTQPLPQQFPYNLVTVMGAPKGKGAKYGSSEYLIQREDGRVIVGGMRHVVPGGELGETDDSVVHKSVSDGLLHFLERLYNTKVLVEREWTGIMGYSSTDGMPLVGELSGCSGCYVAIGFTGHGMPQCFGAARGIAELMLHGSSQSIPHLFNPKRFASCSGHSKL